MFGGDNKRVGHAYEFRTVLDFYYFERIYYAWNQNKHINTFQALMSFLY
jgi:hypothetical protein